VQGRLLKVVGVEAVVGFLTPNQRHPSLWSHSPKNPLELGSLLPTRLKKTSLDQLSWSSWSGWSSWSSWSTTLTS